MVMHRLNPIHRYSVLFTLALLLVIPLAVLAADGHYILATILASFSGPILAWLHEHL